METRKKKVSDEAIVSALMTYETKQVAAESLGITPQTISMRLRSPKLVSKYNDAKADVLRSVIVRLSAASSTALDLIVSSVNDETIPISLRLQSAKDIIRMNREYIEIDDLARRIQLLEDSIVD